MNTKETKSAGGIVLNKKGQVIVVSQRGTSWSLPKGHMEMGETPLQAARREIFEECGLRELQFIKELGSYQRYKISLDQGDDTSELKTIHMFLFFTNQEILKPLDPENPEARWVDRQEVAPLLTHKKDQEFFLKVMEEINFKQ